MSPIFSGFWCVLLVSSITSHFDSNALARPPTQARKWRKVSGIANLLPRARRLQDRPSAAFDLSWYLRTRARPRGKAETALPPCLTLPLSLCEGRSTPPPSSLPPHASVSLSPNTTLLPDMGGVNTYTVSTRAALRPPSLPIPPACPSVRQPAYSLRGYAPSASVRF